VKKSKTKRATATIVDQHPSGNLSHLRMFEALIL